MITDRENSLNGSVVRRLYQHYDGQSWKFVGGWGLNALMPGIPSYSGEPLPAALLPWSNTRWTTQASPGTAIGSWGACAYGRGKCEARAGSPSGVIFSAGANGRLYRNAGAQVTELGNVAVDKIAALSVRNQEDVWAFHVAKPNVRHFDGKTWSSLPAFPPNLLPAEPRFYGPLHVLAPLAANNVWIAPAELTLWNYRDDWNLKDGRGVLHWDGVAWSAHLVGMQRVVGMLAFAPNNIWVALARGLAHWDGAVWSVNDMPFDILSMSGSTPTDIWLMTASTSREEFAVRHGDGRVWTTSPCQRTEPASMVGIGAEAWTVTPPGSSSACIT